MSMTTAQRNLTLQISQAKPPVKAKLQADLDRISNALATQTQWIKLNSEVEEDRSTINKYNNIINQHRALSLAMPIEKRHTVSWTDDMKSLELQLAAVRKSRKTLFTALGLL